MTTWRKLIAIAMESPKDPGWDRGSGETWANVVACTLTDDELDAEFCDGYGSTNGKPFTLWTANRVYFPIKYDGSEFVAHVARNPDGLPTEHWGCG